ncbi:MAG TPA: hypothetical protein VK791_01600 [bacterium]|nr:hypothetical protein [bacterium]
MNQTNQSQPHGAVHADLFFPVKYRLFHNDPIFKNNFNVGRSLDVSMESILLAVGKHNPVNTKLDMELELPDGLSAYVVGKVLEGVDDLINGIVYHFDKIALFKLDKEAEDLITHQILETNRKKGRKV